MDGALYQQAGIDSFGVNITLRVPLQTNRKPSRADTLSKKCGTLKTAGGFIPLTRPEVNGGQGFADNEYLEAFWGGGGVCEALGGLDGLGIEPLVFGGVANTHPEAASNFKLPSFSREAGELCEVRLTLLGRLDHLGGTCRGLLDFSPGKLTVCEETRPLQGWSCVPSSECRETHYEEKDEAGIWMDLEWFLNGWNECGILFWPRFGRGIRYLVGFFVSLQESLSCRSSFIA